MTNAATIREALTRLYGCDDIRQWKHEWVALTEMSVGPGSHRRRIDMMVIGPERHAIEIKVSRSDLRSELANPDKRVVFERFCHRFYFAYPAGLVDLSEVPETCGVYEVADNGAVTERRRAWLNPAPVDPGHTEFAQVALRAWRAETQIAVAAKAVDPGGVVAHLAAETLRIQSLLDQRTRTLTDHRAATGAAFKAIVVACKCGSGTITPKPDPVTAVAWAHTRRGVDCETPRPATST